MVCGFIRSKWPFKSECQGSGHEPNHANVPTVLKIQKQI
uniref:Uncharacterized protein n=1 Tax=Anguilla anguilla TaxID=7936 RepID=A0A0E9PSN8_ANGAN